jgi:hypothetical protein
VFAWSAKDLTSVDRIFIEHKLNIDAAVKPRRQKLRKMSDDKVVAVKSEVQRLLDASVICEVMYPKWLANTVPVKKKNGKWRMCIDFTDLNKATRKDNFPLPRMDQVIDSAASAAIMSLLDCCSSYHQCSVVKLDEEKTSFITPFGTFDFVRMPEGLKNVGPTFTRMTGEVFKLQIGRNIQAYIDDLIVKSSERSNHISDLAKTFASMRRAGLKLNPQKCVFGVTKGKFLGCLISVKKIEANPDKIKATREMEEPKTRKDIQKLNGRVATLKNAGPTFTKMTGELFKPQIGRNIQAYVDELIVKSGERSNHINDLAKTFANMRRAGLKLNPEKCVFGVTKGKILGCLISVKKIEANPDKIKAVREMGEPKTRKNIQKLNGRVVALNRFISKSAE